MFKWLNDWLSGNDESWIRQVKATESGKWLSPQEMLGIQTQGDADIAKALIEKRQREGFEPYWWTTRAP
jgi:hypothetical protein